MLYLKIIKEVFDDLIKMIGGERSVIAMRYQRGNVRFFRGNILDDANGLSTVGYSDAVCIISSERAVIFPLSEQFIFNHTGTSVICQKSDGFSHHSAIVALYRRLCKDFNKSVINITAIDFF